MAKQEALVEFCAGRLCSHRNAEFTVFSGCSRYAKGIREEVQKELLRIFPGFVVVEENKEFVKLANGPDDIKLFISLPSRDISLRGAYGNKTDVVIAKQNGEFVYFPAPVDRNTLSGFSDFY